MLLSIILKDSNYKLTQFKVGKVPVLVQNLVFEKQARSFKSVIKLDKNFHIYIHGDRNLIEQGEDNKGKYYKVYYQEEN
jgi:hypothetical protein